jgi:cell division protein FtsB
VAGPGRRTRSVPSRARPDRRGVARPATRRVLPVRSRAPRGAESPPELRARRRAARRTALTGRAAILAVALAVLGLSVAYPLRQYLVQRAEINRLSRQVHEQQRRVVELQAERERWDDPAYIKAQARKRLHFCMPGETCYVTIDSGSSHGPRGDSTAGQSAPAGP